MTDPLISYDCNCHFEQQHERHTHPAIRALERDVLGCDFGGTSWTTKAQADQIPVALDLDSDSHLLEIGAGTGWPGLYMASLTGCDVTLLDFSLEALAFSETETKKAKNARGSEIEITIVNKSIDTMLRESTKKAGTSDFITERYDVVYCAGLFDYLTDSVCNRLISLYYEWLLPGGLLMVTNVHSNNPQKIMMEYLLEWNIFARDEKKFEELNTIPVQSEIFLDETGVNVFLKMRKNEK